MKSTITYIDALNYAINAISGDPTLGNPEMEAKLTALREQIAKRNSAERKPTKVQRENANLQEVVLSVLSDTPHTVSELMAMDATLSALSNQKVSALVNALVRDGKATKVADKRVNRFALA